MIWRMLAAGGDIERKRHTLLGRFRKLESRSEGLLWDGTDRWKRASQLLGYPNFFNFRARDANRCLQTFFDAKRLGLSPDDAPLQLLRNSVAAERSRSVALTIAA